MKVLLKMTMILFFLAGVFSCGMLPSSEDQEMDMAEQGNFEEGEDSSGEELVIAEEEGEDLQSDEGMEEESTVASSEESSDSMSSDSMMGTHIVKEGETLMQIAFKLYGDYRVWRQIKEVNQLMTTELTPGTQIKYKKPAEEFVWNPSGNPYLIRRGDTLGSISMEKYQTTKKWRDIYENNRPLIRDPNLIFAGFTIYYHPGLQQGEQTMSDSSPMSSPEESTMTAVEEEPVREMASNEKADKDDSTIE